jgi:hypothetical protein
MKITITNHNDQRQAPEVTIDTKSLTYPYAIRNALGLALELDGYDKSTIDEVFYRDLAVPCQDKEEPVEESKWSIQELGQILLEGGSIHLGEVGQYLFVDLIDHFEQAFDTYYPFDMSDPGVLKLKPEYVQLKHVEEVEKEDKGFQWYVDRVLEGQYVFPTTKNMFERVKDYFFTLYRLNPFEVSAPDVLKLKHEYVNVKTEQAEPSEEYLKAKNLDNKFCRGVIILLEEGSLYVDDTDTFDRLSKFFLQRNMAFKEMDREGGILRLGDQFKYLKK